MNTLLNRLLPGCRQWLQQLARRHGAARRRAADRALLAEMSGRDLVDIGIGRGEIAWLVTAETSSPLPR